MLVRTVAHQRTWQTIRAWPAGKNYLDGTAMDGQQKSLSFVALVWSIAHSPHVINTLLSWFILRRVIYSHHFGAIGSRARSAPIRQIHSVSRRHREAGKKPARPHDEAGVCCFINDSSRQWPMHHLLAWYRNQHRQLCHVHLFHQCLVTVSLDCLYFRCSRSREL